MGRERLRGPGRGTRRQGAAGAEEATRTNGRGAGHLPGGSQTLDDPSTPWSGRGPPGTGQGREGGVGRGPGWPWGVGLPQAHLMLPKPPPAPAWPPGVWGRVSHLC